MSTVKANTFQSVAGGRPAITGGALCLAWGYFTTSGAVITVGDSYNVSSIVRNSTGDFTVNFTTAMASTSYAAPTAVGSGGILRTSAFATGSFTINTYSTGFALADPNSASFAVFGD